MLERLLKEKELLMREVNHRVKNNLATVQSLLSIQQSSSSDPAVLEALGEAMNRIQSVSLTHQLLYGSMNTQTISIRSYLEKLVEGIRDSFQTDRRVVTILLDVPEQDLGADMVRNIGLIVNEAVTNSLKHAFNGGKGEIQIRLQLEEGANPAISTPKPVSSPTWILTIIDNGKGIAPEKTATPESMGLLIIQSLTETLQGTFEIGPYNPALARPGTRLMVRFPVKLEGSVTKPGGMNQTA
jgi:two-component sensor histidine kinase